MFERGSFSAVSTPIQIKETLWKTSSIQLSWKASPCAGSFISKKNTLGEIYKIYVLLHRSDPNVEKTEKNTDICRKFTENLQ
jgi:hypothetical protein